MLFVDDSRYSHRPDVRTYRDKGGYSVLTSSDGAEGLNVFQQHQEGVALLLSEVTTPKLDGLQLADAVITLRPQLPMIFTPGNMQYADRGYGCIAKPFTSGELVGKVRQVLASKEVLG